VEQDYKGYNLVSFSGRYFALPQSWGPFSVTLAAQDQYLSAVSTDDLHRVLDFAALAASDPPRTPYLLEEDDHRYNVIYADGMLYAVLRGDAFTVERFQSGGYSGGFASRDLASIRLQIENVRL
jgi:hypothetical protein